jgi:signal transduction histidine kinase
VLLATTFWLYLKLKRDVALRKKEVQEKQVILSVVSHDIKAPFNRIFALTQLLAFDKEKLTPEHKDYLGKIHQVVADGLGLIRNLVDYRNIEYRGIQILPENIDISYLVTSSVRNIRSLAEKKEIVIQTDIDPGIEIESDNICVSRVIDSALSNAIKFSEFNRKIFVTLRDTKRDHVRIEIKDEGPGFSEEDLTKVFLRFQKLSAIPTSGESTTGLGLYNAKKMITRVGGEIQISSKFGEGTTVIIKVPTKLKLAE